MKRFVILIFLSGFISCLPDNTGNAGTSAADSPLLASVDTFSVKKNRPLTVEEHKEALKEKEETDQIVRNAAIVIQEGSPGTGLEPTGVVTNPDVAAMFPGGQAAMEAWIKKKLIYPYTAFQNEIRGTVWLKVVIEGSGKIGGITVAKGLGYGCDEAATDCIRSMPAWTPAQKNGVNVRTLVTIPVTFV